jgi:hypothetical protein
MGIPKFKLEIFRDCIKKDLTKNIAKLKDGQRIKEDTLGYKFK